MELITFEELDAGSRMRALVNDVSSCTREYEDAG
jgi:hypothetical protein